MDEHKSPEDILDEIMNRDPSPAPSRFEPNSPEAPPPSGPGEPAPPNWAAVLLPWLCLVLGAALLVLGICVLQVGRVNSRLDALERAVEDVAYIDQLRRENKALQQEKETLKEEVSQKQTLIRDAEQSKQEFATLYYNQQTETKKLNCLWFLERFMEAEDYPMAAVAVSFSIYLYFYSDSDISGIPLNQAQDGQYQAYCQELLNRGYLQEPSSGYLLYGGSNYALPGRCDPNEDPDTAALGILWCSLEAYYIDGEPYKAAQFLVNYQELPLKDYRTDSGNPQSVPYPQRIRDFAQEGTIQLYDQLIRDLVGDGHLVQEDGRLELADGSLNHYELPFDPHVDLTRIPLG